MAVEVFNSSETLITGHVVLGAVNAVTHLKLKNDGAGGTMTSEDVTLLADTSDVEFSLNGTTGWTAAPNVGPVTDDAFTDIYLRPTATQGTGDTDDESRQIGIDIAGDESSIANTFSDDFPGASLDTATNWATCISNSGTVVVASSILTLDTNSDTSKSAAIRLKALSFSRATERRYRMKFKTQLDGSLFNVPLMCTYDFAAAPTSGDGNTAMVAARRIYPGAATTDGTDMYFNEGYKDAAGTHQAPADYVGAEDTWYHQCLDVKQNGGVWQWRMQLLDAAGTSVLYDGAWVSFSATYAITNTEYLVIGDLYTDAAKGKLLVDSFVVFDLVP